MQRVILVGLLVFGLVHCAIEVEEYLWVGTTEIQFDQDDIRQVEHLMRDVAKHWGFTYTAKDKAELEFLLPEEDTFMIVLYDGREPVLQLSNLLPSDVLDLVIPGHSAVPPDKLLGLVSSVSEQLENQFGIEFEVVEQKLTDSKKVESN